MHQGIQRGVRCVRWLVVGAMLVAGVLGPAAGAQGITPTSTVSGRVTNAAGTGIPGVLVSAVNTVNYYESDYGYATSDAAGYYTIALESGAPSSFKVMFDPLDTNDTNDTDYLGEFYDDYDYPLGSTDVSAGATNVNAVLEVGGRITGTVFAPGGVTPLPDIEVSAATGYVLQPWTMTEADGTYVLRGVAAPSSWNVYADPDFYNLVHETSYLRGAVFTMVVPGTPTTGVDITLGVVVGPPPPPPPPPPPAPVVLVPVFRFYNVTNNTHFYTDSLSERDMVIAKWSNVYNYEGPAYNLNPANNTQPLTRLYNSASGSHFYTASPGEAASALAKWPNVFSLDGLTYAVNPGPVANSIPVFRFYNVRNGSHFFTASEGERDDVIAKYPKIYSYEGPAFWLGQ